MVIFRLLEHPNRPNFYQCVDFGSYPSKWIEKLYTLNSLLFLYGLPLLVIVTCYTIVSMRSIYQQKKASAIRNKNLAQLKLQNHSRSQGSTSTPFAVTGDYNESSLT